ncbi:TetR/AcrR family transcriptional regulator [Bacillus sp. DJP31]|uniref:TetR/AcrR family transcriptional regulator n=1 Tax=Bacillus sp. DJP31 TaxID=3409789 RepID=UPI003BB71074
MEVSIELFSKRGFSGASIRGITKDVGIKESSLCKHFRNKDEILETIFVNFRKETDKILPPMEHINWIVETMTLKDSTP